MKGLAAIAILLVLGMSVYNWYEIRSLRQEIVRLEEQVQANRSTGISDQALQKAMELMFQAKVALANTDWTKARSSYESVSQQISAAAKTAGQKSGPALRWLQDQARDLGSQIQQRVPATR